MNTRSSTADCCLPDLFPKALFLRFDEQKTSSDGGAILLKAADRRLGIVGAMAGALIERRQATKVRHPIERLLRQRVFGIGCGYFDANDAARLRDDPVHALLIGSEDAATQPTLSRFENSVDRKGLFRMARSSTRSVLSRQRSRLGKKVRVITVDLDVTDDPTHGQQELTYFHGYYLKYCYLPLLAFVSFNDEPEQYLVAAMLRPGNSHDTKGMVPLLKRLLGEIRTFFPNVEIRVRTDAGFASPKTFDFLDAQHNVSYAIGIAKNSILRGLCDTEMKKVRARSGSSGRTEKEYGSFRYASGTWSRKRRVVFKAEVTSHPNREQKDNQRFVATNMKQPADWVYSKFYAGRGDVENRIKELLYGVQIDRTSCSRFLANQFRVLLAAAAFALIQEIRLNAAGTSHSRAQAWTIMTRLIKIGVRVETSMRRIVFHLPAAFPDRDDWIRIARALSDPRIPALA